VLAVLFTLEFVVVWQNANRFFYYLDDVKWLAASYRFPLTFQFLTQPVNDHFAPGFLLFQTLPGHLFGYRYELVALTLTVFVSAISVVLWHLGRQLQVNELVRLVIITGVGLSPVLIENTGWWSAGLHALPSTLLTLSVWLVYFQLLDGRWRFRSLLGAVLIFLDASFIEKVVIWVVLIPLFDLICLRSFSSIFPTIPPLRIRVRFYLGLLAGTLGFIAWWVLSVPLPARAPIDLARYARFTGLSWFEGFWPMVLSVRSPSYLAGHLGPGTIRMLIVVQCVLLICAIAWVVRSPRRAASLITWFALSFISNQFALAAGRDVNIFAGAQAGRYQADSLVGLTIVFLCAASRRSIPAHPQMRNIKRPVVAFIAAACALVGVLQVRREGKQQPTLLTVDSLERRAVDSLRSLPKNSVVLDDATPWSPEASPFNHASDLAILTNRARSLHVTDVGPSPFWAITEHGTMALNTAPSSREQINTCASSGHTIAFPVNDTLTFTMGVRPTWITWVDAFASATPTEITLQLSVDGQDMGGPLSAADAWFGPGPPPQVVTLDHSNPEKVEFPDDPRWSGTVRSARVVVLTGRICIGEVGFGFLR
jgi:hypothetical protein